MIRCTLDEDQCIDLLRVLRVVNKINQEQAWAIGYQLSVLMRKLTTSRCAPIESLEQIHLHKEGYIHHKTCSINRAHHHMPQDINQSTNDQVPSTIIINNNNNNNSNFNTSNNDTIKSTSKLESPPTTTTTTTTTTTNTTNTTNDTTLVNNGNNNNLNTSETNSILATTNPIPHTNHLQPPSSPPTPPITPELINEILRRRPALNEAELAASLGIALFWALDYGIPDDEERKLCFSMEYLIYQSQSEMSLDTISEMCINRLPIRTKSHADLHYKEVCKSLISDTIELSIFLEKIYTASMVLSDISVEDCCDISDLKEPFASLRSLRFNDWARLWMQVIRELRQRGKRLT